MRSADIKSDHRYTPLFCKENIWQLAHERVADGIDPDTLQVIFISNADKQVVLFNQRNGAELGHVVWDYRVVLRRYDEEGDCIYDFDSLLPFPCNSRDYFAVTFGLQGELSESLRAWLRCIPAAAYLDVLNRHKGSLVAMVTCVTICLLYLNDGCRGIR